MSTIYIRKAEPSEAEMLTTIALASKRYWNYPETDIDLWRESLTFTPANISKAMVYVAAHEEKVVGFYSLIHTLDDTVYELDDLWIQPSYIGQGIGKKLFKHAVALVEAQDGTMLRLVAEPNAIGFYQKMGMRKVAERASSPEGRVLDVMAVMVRSS
ncbi:MAG: GNAT family N-acetyltransferase [Anaerolineae bacterium]|nr:GNAT family N-acetyltransferase [Anaerolineae bacterium]